RYGMDKDPRPAGALRSARAVPTHGGWFPEKAAPARTPAHRTTESPCNSRIVPLRRGCRDNGAAHRPVAAAPRAGEWLPAPESRPGHTAEAKRRTPEETPPPPAPAPDPRRR